MKTLARKECRELPVLQAYRAYLNAQGLREATRKGYGSLASSWIFTVAVASGFNEFVWEEEATCLELASAGAWRELSLWRDSAITARLVTLTHPEVCQGIGEWSSGRNISATAHGINGINRFHGWLEVEGLTEVNHFRDIRARLEFTVSQFEISLRRCREI